MATRRGQPALQQPKGPTTVTEQFLDALIRHQIGLQRLEQAGQVADQPRRVGAGKAQVDHVELGRPDALVPQGLELARVALVALETHTVRVGIAHAEHAELAGVQGAERVAPRRLLDDPGAPLKGGLEQQEPRQQAPDWDECESQDCHA